MKVLQLVPNLNAGGVERGTIEISNFLVSQGHDSVIVSQGGRLVPELIQGGARHVQMDVGAKRPRSFGSIANLASLIQHEKPDVVHPRSRLPAWLTLYALRRIRRWSQPHLITSVHGLHSVNRYSSIVSRGELVETVSASARQYLLSNYPKTDPDKCRVVHRGVDPSAYFSEFTPATEWLQRWRALDLPSNKRLVVLPGRISELKGHDVFFDALEKLITENAEIYALVIGEPDKPNSRYFTRLNRRITNSSTLSESVRFLGFRSDLREIFAVADVVVSCSIKPEAFGRVVLEALSLGTPVVGFDHGGVGELLRQFYPAGAVRLNDVNDLVVKISSALNVGHIHIDHTLTIERMCRETLSLYEEVIR